MIDDTLWAKKQLAANFDNSAEALFVKISLSSPTNLKRFERLSIFSPFLLPKITLSGLIKSLTAVP